MPVISTYVHETMLESFDRIIKDFQTACDLRGLEFSWDVLSKEVVEEPVYVSDGLRARKVGVKDVDMYKVEITYEEPEEVFHLVGRMERVKTRNIIEKNTKTDLGIAWNNKEIDIEIPDEYLHDPLRCEHCKSGRALKKSFIVYNSEEDYVVQVAQGCLKGYTFFDGNVENKFWSMPYSKEKVEGAEKGSRTEIIYDLDEVLDASLYHYLTEGVKYVSVADSTDRVPTRENEKPSTSKQVKSLLYRDIRKELDSKRSEIDSLKQSLKHFLITDKRTYYERDTIEAFIEDNAILDKKVGFIIYLTFSFMQHGIGETETDKGKTVKSQVISQHVGIVGEVYEGEVTFKREVEFDSFYGVTRMLFFETDFGDIIVWKTSSVHILDKESRVKVKGRVKEHNEFRDAKQTFLTRVRLKEVDIE